MVYALVSLSLKSLHEEEKHAGKALEKVISFHAEIASEAWLDLMVVSLVLRDKLGNVFVMKPERTFFLL